MGGLVPVVSTSLYIVFKMAAGNRRNLLSLELLVLLRERRRRSREQLLQKRRIRNKKRWWVRPMLRDRKLHGQYHSLMARLKAEDREYYYRFLRMSPERFSHLAQLLTPLLQKESLRREPISVEERLAITLRYLATGDSQQSQSFNFLVGRTTVTNIIKETTDAIWNVLHAQYLKCPATQEEWKAISQRFEEEWDLPHVVGAIDGKHVAMDCPKYGGSLFYNYKGFHSTVLMAICDAKYCFIYADIGSYGRDNDAAIFRDTGIYQDFDSNRIPLPAPEERNGFPLPYFLVGDDIFPLKEWLMKLYKGAGLSEQQQVFNYRLSRARRTIENAFGVLSARWRIYRRPIRANADTVDKIVKATICLHNYLSLTDNAMYIPAGFVDCYNQDGTIKPGDWRREVQGYAGTRAIRNMNNPGNTRYDAKDIREALNRYVNSPNGSVEWQLAHVRDAGPQLLV